MTQGLPALAQEETLTLGQQPPAPPARAVPNHCHGPGMATAGAGAPCRRAHGRLDPTAANSVFLQLQRGEKRAGSGGAARQRSEGTGHSWPWSRPRDAAPRWHRGSSPAATKWELWEHRQDQEAAATLGSSPRSSSQARGSPGARRRR